ncbi:hypothetical protein [Peptacetobacter sp.]|uniref:hypothetical protein n=1 Tax=Peptacetobacter sp. TaxID=2991975 RepID=UPI00263038F1|nr:hypothetical protein [Peptacetobacter sp.]
MYSDKLKFIMNMIIIAIIFILIQILGMIICLFIFKENILMSIVVMIISNLIMYVLI